MKHFTENYPGGSASRPKYTVKKGFYGFGPERFYASFFAIDMRKPGHLKFDLKKTPVL